MGVASSEGIFGFGPQSSKGTTATTWYRHKAASVRVGPQQAINQFPAEVGDGYQPGCAYKSMAFGAGTATMFPRLKEYFGYLAYAACGQLSDTEADTPEPDLHTHHFTPASETDDYKWLSIRRYIPGNSDDEEIGEIITDCRVTSMRLTVAPTALLGARFGFVGRKPQLARNIDSGDAQAWSWDGDYDACESVPLGNKGFLKLDGVEKPAVQCTIDLQNLYTTPGNEMIIGEYYPDDFQLRRQIMTVTWTYKWKDPTLYRRILTEGSTPAAGVYDWSSEVHTTSFSFKTESPADVSGKSNPYSLTLWIPELAWRSSAPPVLAGGGYLMQQFVGVAQEQATGGDPVAEDYFDLKIVNDTASYTWS